MFLVAPVPAQLLLAATIWKFRCAPNDSSCAVFIHIYKYFEVSLLIHISDKFVAKLSHYDVVIPSFVDSSGQFISHTLQRTDHEELHMHVPAFGKNFHLHVTRNSGLLGPGFVTESGGKLQRVHQQGCHFTGRIKNQTASLVAISTCRGLVSADNSSKCDAIRRAEQGSWKSALQAFIDQKTEILAIVILF